MKAQSADRVVATWLVDQDGRAVSVSANIEAVLGIEPGALLESNENLLTRIFPDDQADARACLKRTHWTNSLIYRLDVRGKTRFISHIAAESLDADGRALALHVATDVSSKFTGDIVCARDLTRVLDELTDGILACFEGRLTWVNQAFARTIGVEDRQDLVGKNVVSLLHPDDVQALEGEPGIHPNTRIRDGQFSVLTETRAVLTMALSLGPTVSIGGTECTLLVARDISELNRLQSQLLLADRMASVGTLAAGVAHEINNPLSYTIGNIDFALEEIERLVPEGTSPEFDEVIDMLRDAHEGAERVRLIVGDLRTFSRSDEGEVESLDVRAVLEQTIGMALNEIRHRARLVKQFEEVPSVRGSVSRLGQVFLNLLVNAAHAIPEGEASSNEIRVSLRPTGDRVVVEIMDTGIGIPEENLTRIFDPFFTTKSVGDGTGLGLSICHNVLTSLGGDISVESELGVGTTFRVTLSTSDDLSFSAVAPKAADPKVRRDVAVLVIDDEIGVLRVLKRTLNDFDVTVAQSGTEALDLVAQGRFDVIFCDLMMPDVTGMDVFERLLERRPAQANRMVFMTGGAFTPRARTFLARVANRHIEKPFHPQEARDLVNVMVDEQGTA